ncbi:MAG: SPOR domain-containing protein [Actinomycetota bacterium]
MTDTGSASPTCIRCGEPVASDALRCPHCALTFPALQDIGARQAEEITGASASPPPPPPLDPAATASHGAAAGTAPPPPRADTAPQPIFPPSATVEESSNRWRWLAAAAVVIVAVVAVVLMASGGDDPVAEGPPPEPEIGPTSFELVDDQVVLSVDAVNLEEGDAVRLVIDGEQVDERRGPSPVTLTWTGATEGEHRLVVQVRRNEQQTETATDIVVPPAVLGIDSFDGWIMALASLETRAQADRYLAELEGIDDGRILLSDDWPSLRPGFWVVYAGPFATGEEVLARCRELDRAIPNDCVGRVLTRNPDDRSIIAN